MGCFSRLQPFFVIVKCVELNLNLTLKKGIKCRLYMIPNHAQYMQIPLCIWYIWVKHGVTHVCYTSSLSILTHRNMCWVPHTCLCSCTLAHIHLEHICVHIRLPYFCLWHSSNKTWFKYAVSHFTYSSDTFFLCSLRGRSIHCSSYTDLRSYKEDCIQLKNTTVLICGDTRKHCHRADRNILSVLLSYVVRWCIK